MENYSFLELRNDTRSDLKNKNDNIDRSNNEDDEKDEIPAISDDGAGRMSDAESNASEQSSKRKMISSMTSPKENSKKIRSNKAGLIWCQVVAQAREKSKRRIPPNRMIQQKFLILLTNASKKSQQFFLKM